MQAGRVETEGAVLYYEIRGEGRPLLMIPGGLVDGGAYAAVAVCLADEFKVITYDRRGNSRSVLHRPENFADIGQQGRDAVAVLRAAGEPDAFVFGNSAGAVIALELSAWHPAVVRAAVVHEAPVIRLLPDKARWQRLFAEIYAALFAFGVDAARTQFTEALDVPQQLDAVELTEAERVQLQEMWGRAFQNDEFFFNHELLPVSNYLPDLERIRQNGVRVIPAAGEATLAAELFYGRTSQALAEQLACPLATFPGHHSSFLEQPRTWADRLRTVLA